MASFLLNAWWHRQASMPGKLLVRANTHDRDPVVTNPPRRFRKDVDRVRLEVVGEFAGVFL